MTKSTEVNQQDPIYQNLEKQKQGNRENNDKIIQTESTEMEKLKTLRSNSVEYIPASMRLKLNIQIGVCRVRDTQMTFINMSRKKVSEI